MHSWSIYKMRVLSGPILNPVLLSLCWSQSAMLPSYNGLCDSCGSLCSLPTMVCVIVSSVVYQSTTLPSNNGLHSSRWWESGCSAPFLQQSAHYVHCLFQFITIFPNFSWIYLYFWVKKRACEKVELCVSSHHSYIGLTYILDKVFIRASGPSWTLY